MSPAALAGAIAAAASLGAAAWAGWWTALSVIALPRPRGGIGRTARPWRLTVVVPAHDEEQGIDACLASLQAASLEPQPEIVVVADNCSDRTAEIARSRGVTVLERHEPERRGKVYALEFALDHLGDRDETPDAVLFIDADTEIDADAYRAVAWRLDRGAQAVQLHYAAGDGTSTLARLRRLAFSLIHWSRPLGMARLGLGSGIKGNGMALRWDVARAGLGGGGITEDAAMTLALARRGVAVVFEPRATVRGYMAERYEQARTQDERWERGRLGLLPTAAQTAAASALRGRIACAAAAADVAAPPLSALAAVAAGAAVVGLILRGALLPLQLAGAAAVMSYVVVGLVASRASLTDVAALRFAPRFVWHKFGVYAALLRKRGDAQWERTERR